MIFKMKYNLRICCLFEIKIAYIVLNSKFQDFNFIQLIQNISHNVQNDLLCIANKTKG